ncbi:MAG: hypothetical protein PHT07_15605 [Paludibacter sp.]|nr:hypothetical protein [Paludibacter sp.]
MERISSENMERQIREMWDAVSSIPSGDPNKQDAFNDAAKTENELRERYREQEALRDAAPELLEALRFMVNRFRGNLWSDKLQEINAIMAKAEGRS